MRPSAFVPLALLLVSSGYAADFTPIERLLDETVAKGEVVGGAVLIIHRGRPVFQTGFGYADLASKKPFPEDATCIIASISKPLLATAAYRLADQGRLDVTAPITRYLPEFKAAKLASGEPLGRAPTMIELFTHTAGTRNDDTTGGRPWFAAWTAGKPLSFVVDRYAREFPFREAPGVRTSYSGIGTDIAARVLEVVSGKPRNELLLHYVCEPLGMTQTFYRNTERANRPVMPTRYYRGKSGKMLRTRKRRTAAPNTYTSSGGSVISTTEDLGRWLMMIRDGGQCEGQAFLSKASIDRMLTPNRVGSFSHGGFYVRRKDANGTPVVIGHTGSSGTNCWLNFEQDTIGVMLTQTRGSDIRPFRVELEKRITSLLAE